MTNNIMKLADAYANDRIELSKRMSASLKSERTLDACGWVDDSRAALQAEVDRVSKDAERYQWLTTTGGGIGMRLAEVEKEWNGCDGIDGFNAAIERCQAKRLKGKS